MVNFTVDIKEIYQNKDKYILDIDFSDNPCLMRYESDYFVDCLDVKRRLNRILDKYNKEKIIKTAAMGFKYIKKSNLITSI